MPEEKIKIKDLAGELDVQSKDMLRALRDLGLPAKTTAGSVSVEDAARLRDHFAGRKQGGVERTEVQAGRCRAGRKGLRGRSRSRGQN